MRLTDHERTLAIQGTVDRPAVAVVSIGAVWWLATMVGVGGCAAELAGDGALCEAVATTLEACQGETPEGFLADCRADADSYEHLAGMSCEALEGNDGKSDLFGGRPYNAECTFNAQCAGEYTCRYVVRGTDLESRCVERASHTEPKKNDRFCDSGINDADCVEGDVCVASMPTRFGTCESESYGNRCECPDSALSCTAEQGGCSADLTCVFGRCRRPCGGILDTSACDLLCLPFEEENGVFHGDFCDLG